jgi:hypothetical protein
MYLESHHHLSVHRLTFGDESTLSSSQHHVKLKAISGCLSSIYGLKQLKTESSVSSYFSFKMLINELLVWLNIQINLILIIFIITLSIHYSQHWRAAVMFQTCIQEVFGFLHSSSAPPGKCQDSTFTMPQLLPCKSLWIHHWLITLSLDAV